MREWKNCYYPWSWLSEEPAFVRESMNGTPSAAWMSLEEPHNYFLECYWHNGRRRGSFHFPWLFILAELLRGRYALSSCEISRFPSVVQSISARPDCLGLQGKPCSLVSSMSALPLFFSVSIKKPLSLQSIALIFFKNTAQTFTSPALRCLIIFIWQGQRLLQ